MSDEKRTKFVPIATFFGVVVGLGLGIVIGHYGISDEYCDTRGFVEPSQQIDMDLRRTTLCVYNMTKSLEFYEIGLGMTRIYDNIIKTPSNATTPEESDKWRHLIFLRANNEHIGVLGLYEYIKPRRGAEIRNPDRDFSTPNEEYFRVGDTVLLLTSSSSMDERIQRVLQVDNVYLAEKPMIVEFPGYDDESSYRVNLTTVVDPDGNLVEINQILPTK